MRLRRLLASGGAALLVLSSALAAGCAGDQAVVGYYDADRIERQGAQLRELQEEGTEKLREKQKEMEEKFRAKEEELNQALRDNPPASQEEFEQRQQEAAAEAQKLQREADIQLQGLRAQYQMQMRQRVDKAVDSIAREKKLDVVLDNSALQKSVIFGGVDITEDMLERLK